MIAHEISDLYRAETCGRPAELGAVGSYVDFASVERRSAGQVFADHQAVAAWREFLLSHGGELPAFPVPVNPEQTASVPQEGTCHLLLDPAETAVFEARCRERGGSSMAGSLACLALAGQVETGCGVFGALMSIHTRSAVEWAESMRWYVGLAPLEVTVRPGDAFADVLTAVMATTRAAKAMAAIPFERIAELLGCRLAPRFVVSYMDLRRVPGADRWATGRRPRCARAARTPMRSICG